MLELADFGCKVGTGSHSTAHAPLASTATTYAHAGGHSPATRQSCTRLQHDAPPRCIRRLVEGHQEGVALCCNLKGGA